ncbi:FkbM family methyltransferase [Patescibacteria group bacterium]|nr:FkbM family methyltransferase [Patescibacteria group bacterium]
MPSKADLYRIIENITPPVVFRLLKASSLLPTLVRITSRLSGLNRSQVVTVTGGDLQGYALKLNPTGPWQHEMISGMYDKELFELIKQYSLSGTVVYDIGAHIGYHTLLFATLVGKQGHVYAFEPNPANAKRAQEIAELNTELHSTISIHNLALSDTRGSTEFLSTDDIEGGSSTGGFINDASTLWERNRYVNKIGFTKSTVTIETIDHLIAQKIIQPPHLMKIDVEGAEQLVLGGALDTLRTYRPTIIVEFHSIFSTFACLDLLQTLAYKHTILKKEPDGRVMIVSVPQ